MPTDLTGALLPGARLDRAVLTEAVLVEASLTGATLVDAQLQGVQARRANLLARKTGPRRSGGCGYRRRRSLLRGSTPSARLRGARLVLADLRGADLRARLHGADLKGAHSDATTRWPDAFQPARHASHHHN